jgi:hypothetical protein
MAKSYEDLLKNIREWSVPTAHTAHTTTVMSVRTDLSKKAKRPSVIQPQKIPFSKAEKEKRGIRFFQLKDGK